MNLRVTYTAVWCAALFLSHAAFAQPLSSQSVDYEKQEGTSGNLVDIQNFDSIVSKNQMLGEKPLANTNAAAVDTYSITPLIRDNLDGFYWASTVKAPTVHLFDGLADSGGGNFFGTPGGLFRVAEGITSLGGNAERYTVEVSAVSSSIVQEPWVDVSWAGSGLTDWILEVGTSSGGGDPLFPGYLFNVLDSGVFLFNSAGTLIGDYDLYNDASSDIYLGGTAWINNGGSDIAGVDVAAMQMYWDITPTPADLALQLIDVTNGTYAPGDTIEIHNYTKNIGALTSSSYVITFYASTDTVISNSDIELGSNARSGLAFNEAHNFLTQTSLPIDIPENNYYIGAILTVSDANSSNNVNYDPSPIFVEVIPVDIALTFIDAGAGSYLPGSTLEVWTGFENMSSIASEDFGVGFFASVDSNITPDDHFLGGYNIFAFDPFEIKKFPLEVTLPNTLGNGNYYIGAILDISDANSANNVIYGPVPINVATTSDIMIRPLELSFSDVTSFASTAEVEAITESDQIYQDYQLASVFQAGLMDKAAKEGSVRVIVGFGDTFRPEGLLQSANLQTQRQEILSNGKQLLDSLTGFNYQENVRYTSIPFLALTVDVSALEHLLKSKLVTSIEEDSRSKPFMATSNQVIGSPIAWSEGYDGSGQTVAILDTGVDKAHSWFTNGGTKVVSEACYSTNNLGVSVSLCPGGVESSVAPGSGVNCEGLCDHGTHVAGSAAGNDGAGPGYGVARGADIIAVQVFSQFENELDCPNGIAPCILTYKADQISALERVNELRNTYDIASVNMSLGGGQYFSQTSCDADNPSIKAAIDNLRSVGIATVIAAGNDGYRDSIGTPACISTAISVGNTRRNDEISQTSNIYPDIHLLAPGTDINSSVPDGGVEAMTGTSMAAPHVAGAWAVLKQINPDATVSEILTKLQTTSTAVDDNRTDGVEQTMPRINLDAAMNIDRTTFGIFNKGPAALEITSITPETAAPWINLSLDAPFNVPANQMLVISVTIDYNTAPLGDSQIRLLINSNDPDESPYPNGILINVTSAMIPEPEFSSNPMPGALITFGDTSTGTSSTPKMVVVDNLGTADLTLSCNITGTNADQFNLVACPSPVTPAGSTNISVRCEPSTLGSKQASLAVLTNDVDEGAVSYNLSCQGIVPPPDDMIFSDSFENQIGI